MHAVGISVITNWYDFHVRDIDLGKHTYLAKVSTILWETRGNSGKLGNSEKLMETQALNEGIGLNLINGKLVEQEKCHRGNCSTKN